MAVSKRAVLYNILYRNGVLNRTPGFLNRIQKHFDFSNFYQQKRGGSQRDYACLSRKLLSVQRATLISTDDKFYTASSFATVVPSPPFPSALKRKLLKNIAIHLGHNAQCTDVQRILIPRLVMLKSSTDAVYQEHKAPDIFLQGRTGSGKTLVYLWKVAQIVYNEIVKQQERASSPGARVLILTPNWELAAQIFAECRWFLQDVDTRMTVMCLSEDCPRQAEVEILRRQCPLILIGSIQRLLFHAEHTYQFPVLFLPLCLTVIDEADCVLQNAKRAEVEKLLKLLRVRAVPKMFVSGTITKHVSTFQATVSRRPHRFLLTGYTESDALSFASVSSLQQRSVDGFPDVAQYLIPSEPKEVLFRLYSLLSQEVRDCPNTYKIMVFFPTASLARFVGALFSSRLRLPRVRILHPTQKAIERNAVYEALREQATGIMFAPQTAARGIDIPDVSLVIHLGPPQSIENLIHLVGRTGRCGKGGKFFLLGAPKETVLDLPTMENYNDENQNIARKESTFRNLLNNWDAADAHLVALCRSAYRSLLTFGVLHLFSNEKDVYERDKKVVSYVTGLIKGAYPDMFPALPESFVDELQLRYREGIRVFGRHSSAASVIYARDKTADKPKLEQEGDKNQ